MQVELQGRVQKQEQDNAWYTCINYISVSGKPLYGFVPCRQADGRPSAGLCLRQVPSDSRLSQCMLLLQAFREAVPLCGSGCCAWLSC